MCGCRYLVGMTEAALRALQLLDEFQRRKTQIESATAFPDITLDVRSEEEIATEFAAAIREIVAAN